MSYRWLWLKCSIRRFRRETLPRRIAWLLPKPIVMWAYYRVIADEPDPDAGTREQKPIDVIDAWSRYHGLYP